MKKTKWLNRDTVVAPHLALCLNEAEFQMACKYLKIVAPAPWLSNTAAACVHTYESEGKLACIVCLDAEQDCTPAELASLLVHEATHVKQELMLRIGEDSPSKEFEAYTMQRITCELFAEYSRRLNEK
jgi:hypothetical protein